MSPEPTGRRRTVGGRDEVIFERTFAAPIEAVWAAITESARLARWIGVWTGDPASGTVQFRMTAEGEDVPDVNAISFAADYYPATQSHYTALGQEPA
ncbi:MAG: hypothetical protein JWN61_2662 [Pseudonocardiales bacterium]|nr:hypothetical protein [Pseudonocardiales bacterium]